MADITNSNRMSLTIPDNSSRKIITTFATSLKQFFSRKDVSVICFSLAIVIKILLFFYFQLVDTDKLFQAMAGKNLVEGHGLTIKQVHVNNLSNEKYEHLVGWPPAHSVFYAIIYSLFKDLDVSSTVIDIICVILFFIVLVKFLRQLNFPDHLINLLLLFYGCTIPPYVENSTATDFLTLVLFVFNCYLTIKLFTQKNPVLPGILLGFFNVLLAWFRYMYIPVVFIIPGILLWNGWLKKDRKLLLYGTYTMVLAIVGVIILLGLQEPYIVPTEKGIFWSNLLLLDPVLFSSFMNLKLFLVQLEHKTGISYSKGTSILRWINLVPFLILVAALSYSSLKRKLLAANTWQVFMTIATLSGICIFFVLAFLSVTHNAHYPAPMRVFWTYISEDRYFIIFQFLIVVLTARWLFMNTTTAFSLKKWAQGLVLFLFAIEILHGAYFLVKNFTWDRRNYTYIRTSNGMIQFIDNAIKENKKKNIDVVVASSDLSMANRSVLMGGKGIFAPAELNAKDINAGKPTMLIAGLDSVQLAFYKPFLTKEGVKFETRVGEYYFYSYYVTPHTTLKD
jgi:hypothetical protein